MRLVKVRSGISASVNQQRGGRVLEKSSGIRNILLIVKSSGIRKVASVLQQNLSKVS